MVIQLKFYLLCILRGSEKKNVRRIVFLFSFFQQNSRWLRNHMLGLLWRAWSASPICSKEATYPGHMLIRFWCDSDITFSRVLHKNLVTVLYFSIIIVLCGAGGGASFAPQANLVWNEVFGLWKCFDLCPQYSLLWSKIHFFTLKFCDPSWFCNVSSSTSLTLCARIQGRIQDLKKEGAQVTRGEFSGIFRLI